MLRAFDHRIGMCRDMLGAVGSSLKMVKFKPTTPIMPQHVATGWPKARKMLHLTILLTYCDRLAGSLYSELAVG